MKAIKQDELSDQIEIKKSKFISMYFKVFTVNEAVNILKNISDNYSDATHICFAYKIDNEIHCFDDGEPSGTAGKPILNVILKKDLTNILVVVIRYFGGIKLGAGGLTRAYTEATTKVLSLAEIVEVKDMYKIYFHISYDLAFKIYTLASMGYFDILQRIGNDFILLTSPELLNECLGYLKLYNVTNLEIKSVKV